MADMHAQHERKRALNTDLREAIAVGLDEAMTALEESFADLTDEQVRARPIPEQKSIRDILLHVLAVLDGYAAGHQTSQQALSGNRQCQRWTGQAEECEVSSPRTSSSWSAFAPSGRRQRRPSKGPSAKT